MSNGFKWFIYVPNQSSEILLKHGNIWENVKIWIYAAII